MPEREIREERSTPEKEALPDSAVPTATDSWRRHREIHDVVQAIREQRRRKQPER